MGDFDDIESARPEDRARLRAAAVERLGKLQGQSVDRGPFRVTITDGPTVVGDKVTLSVSVVRIATGKDVTPADLNPIVIVNPPLLVPDPAGPITRTDDDGAVATYRFDPKTALLQVVRDLIR